MARRLICSACALLSAASFIQPASAAWKNKRQVPADADGITTISSPSGSEIRYKMPSQEGICETTPGVESYSGYISLNETTNMFFWFFEARESPETAPITLWLNGGPGADSLGGLFTENGPCSVASDLTAVYNEYAWNNASNMLFLSQPLGVGFSYATTETGVIDPITGLFTNASDANATGRYARADYERYDTTDLAAVAAWEILQGFLENLPSLDSDIGNKTFNLWAQSYGGHWGPVFYKYFSEQNNLILNGSQPGCPLHMDTLGLVSPWLSAKIQTPWYPEFALNNTHGIVPYNETIYIFAKTFWNIPGGCSDLIDACQLLLSATDGLPDEDPSREAAFLACSYASVSCRSFVEYPYIIYGGRGVYDIRHNASDEDPPTYWYDYINSAPVQNALGVNINYTSSVNEEVYNAFLAKGDWVYDNALEDLEALLAEGVQVLMVHGDADWICNWFGGEAASLALEYNGAEDFRAAGYEPFTVDGQQYGEVRQYGNLAFLRMYDAGHAVPYYQPAASYEMFRRTIGYLALADGSEPVTETLSTNGTVTATHVNSLTATASVTPAAAVRQRREFSA